MWPSPILPRRPAPPGDLEPGSCGVFCLINANAQDPLEACCFSFFEYKRDLKPIPEFIDPFPDEEMTYEQRTQPFESWVKVRTCRNMWRIYPGTRFFGRTAKGKNLMLEWCFPRKIGHFSKTFLGINADEIKLQIKRGPLKIIHSLIKEGMDPESAYNQAVRQLPEPYLQAWPHSNYELWKGSRQVSHCYVFLKRFFPFR